MKLRAISSRVGCLLALCWIAMGQSRAGDPGPPQAHPQPADLTLLFQTEENRQTFPLGARIPAKYVFVSTSPGQYVIVRAGKLDGGREISVRCEPAEAVADLRQTRGDLDLQRILWAVPGCGAGVGGGIGGGCGACGGELPVQGHPVFWVPFPLNFLLSVNRTCTYVS